MAKIKNKERVIGYLQSLIGDSSAGLIDIPALLRKVIEEDLWRERRIKSLGKIVYFATFREFVEVPAPVGLNTDLKTLQKLCAGDLAILALIDELREKPKRGGDRRSTDFKSKQGTVEISVRRDARARDLKKLQAKSPELHKAVLTGKRNLNKAMIAAGLRQNSIYITRDVVKASRTLRKNFTSEEITLLIKHLSA